MAKQIGRTKMTIHKDLRRLGFSGPGRNAGGNPVYSFGERINGEMVASLVERSGVHPQTFANHIGTAKGTVDHYLYDKRQRHVATKIARKVSSLRNELIRYLVSSSQENPQDQYGPSRVLATFFPDLRARSGLLVKILYQCRKFLQQQPNATAAELGEWLCAQAMAETSGKIQGSLFSDFLPWAPEVIPALDLAVLKTNTPRHIISHDLIAARWHTNDGVVRAAINAEPIPSANMCRLFEHWATKGKVLSFPEPPPKSKGGRPKGMSEERQEEAQELERHIRVFKDEHGTKRGAMVYACRKVYGSVLESHKAIARGQKTLKEYRVQKRKETVA